MAGSLPFIINERNLVKKLREAGATSEKTAKTVEELGLSNFEIREIERISTFTLMKAIKKTSDNRYYVSK